MLQMVLQSVLVKCAWINNKAAHNNDISINWCTSPKAKSSAHEFVVLFTV